jgi:DNA polymerase-3 subunit delta'
VARRRGAATVASLTITAADPFASVVGQEQAVAALRAALASPVHAYLLVGPRGSGKRALGRAFAAALLAADAPTADLAERAARLALEEHHADLHMIEREGSSISVPQVEPIIAAASLSPAEGTRKVFVLIDFHLVQPPAASRLLKTIEEPSETTTFIVLAERVPPELVTIASRCVRIDVEPLRDDEVRAALVESGVADDYASVIAASAGGDLERARLLASDSRFADRRALWWAVPERLDGKGSTVMQLVAQVRGAIDDAQVTIDARHAEEVSELEARVERYGERGSGRAKLVEKQKREVRRFRTDELRFGLATLAMHYRDSLATDTIPVTDALGAIDTVNDLNEALVRNPNESLALQALLLQLPPIPPA